MSALSKTALSKVLSGALSRLKNLDAALVAAEESLGSIQLRHGMVYAAVKDALSQRDDAPSFKDWVAKNRKGRSYSTLNRWATAGATALALGMTDEDETVPPLYKVEPGYRFIRDAKTPEKYAAGVEQLTKWWDSVADKDAATAIARAERLKPSKPRNSGGGGNGGGNGGGDASETITIDPAAVSAIAADIKRRNNLAAYRGVDHATINAARRETALLIREASDKDAYITELLAALSS